MLRTTIKCLGVSWFDFVAFFVVRWPWPWLKVGSQAAHFQSSQGREKRWLVGLFSQSAVWAESSAFSLWGRPPKIEPAPANLALWFVGRTFCGVF